MVPNLCQLDTLECPGRLNQPNLQMFTRRSRVNKTCDDSHHVSNSSTFVFTSTLLRLILMFPLLKEKSASEALSRPGWRAAMKYEMLALHQNDTWDLVSLPCGRLFIADTNNSLIRYLNLNNKEPKLLTLELKGVQTPAPKSKSMRRLRRRSAADAEIILIDGGSSIEGKFHLKITVPEGYHLSKEAQSKFSVEIEPENAASVNPLDGIISLEGSAVVQFKRSLPSPSKSKIYCKVYYCKEDEVCLYRPLMFEVSFREAAPSAAPVEITLPYIVKPKSSTFDLQTPVPL